MPQSLTLLSRGDAERLTERIKVTVAGIDDSLLKLRNLIDQAQQSNVWQVLGYASWTAYVAALFENRDYRLTVERRREVTALLDSHGMSSRAIAPIVGASQSTVTRQIRETTKSDDSPDNSVTGIDGKTYPSHEPHTTPKARRRPLTDQARDAGRELRRTIEKLERILSDDRLAANHEHVSGLLRGNVTYAQDALAAALEKLTD